MTQMSSNPSKQIKIGFIGQGWIGKHLANHFEERGFNTIRFAKEPPYHLNEKKLAAADIIFVAVPTPTTPEGFDDSILRGVMKYASPGQTLVIKSTVLPGTTDSLATEYPGIYIFHSPEFLREASVKEDIAHPDRNIIGIPTPHAEDPAWRNKAVEVMNVLPEAPYNAICTAPEAELTKYGGNNFLYLKVVFMNMLHDLAMRHNADWDIIARNMTADPRIGSSHMQPVHQHDHMGKPPGRGAGGHCFIKDFAALRSQYEALLPEEKETIKALRALEAVNNRYLRQTEKDPDLLEGVYGTEALCVCRVDDEGADCVCRFSAKKKE